MTLILLEKCLILTISSVVSKEEISTNNILNETTIENFKEDMMNISCSGTAFRGIVSL